MAASRTCAVDDFAAEMASIMNEVKKDCAEASNRAVAQSVRKGAKTVKEKAKATGKHPWSPEYVGGFSSHVDRRGDLYSGEIGNKAKPGLVHLLEKGHATLTGRRTQAYPHMAPAFEEIKDDYIERMDKYIGGALR